MSVSSLSLESEWWTTVARLRYFRGIDTLIAFVLCFEVSGFHRFERPALFALSLDLVPASTGRARAGRGAITKFALDTPADCSLKPTGTTCVSSGRCHDRKPPARRADPVLQIAWRAQYRLYLLHRRLRGRTRTPATPASSRSPHRQSYSSDRRHTARRPPEQPPHQLLDHTAGTLDKARSHQLWFTRLFAPQAARLPGELRTEIAGSTESWRGPPSRSERPARVRRTTIPIRTA